MSEHGRSVKSVETMFDIVELLVDQNGAHVTDLSRELDLAKSTVHRHLATLCSLGYAVKEGEEYHAGLRFLAIGEHVKNRTELSRRAKPLVEQLADETGERAQFIVEEHNRGVFLHIEKGEHGVRADRHPGKRRYLHSSAAGKAILAHMPRDRVEEVIDQWGLPAETSNTIPDEAELFEELDRIRDQGYATNKEESISGLWAIGVPVVVSGDPVGAFSLSGPKRRLDFKKIHEEYSALLQGTANELEIKMEYS